jgi:gliding motility-associated-like protein
MNSTRLKYITVKSTYVIFILSAFLGVIFSQAQTPDCEGALGVCSNGAIDANSSGPGTNDFAGGTGSLGCIDAEHQSLWLFVQIESGSTLGFVIDPIGADDYDFAVYGPNRTCNNLGNPIRCSWAAGSSNTGMTSNASDVSEGAGGDGFVRWLTVNPGDTYYILIDNYSATNQGFSLNWNGNSSLNCDVALPCPVVDLGPDTSICDGSSRTLGNPIVAGVTYLWSTGATTPTINVTTSGTYWLAATKDTCTVIDSIVVTSLTSPIVNLGRDTTLCPGETIILNAAHPDATGYVWQDGSTGPTFQVSGEGIYSVEVQNDICSGTDQIQVFYENIPLVDLGNDTALCGVSSYVLNDAGTYPPNTQFVWQDGSTSATFNATQSGIYSVEVSNIACSNSDTINLSFQNPPIFDLGNDATFCEDTVITLDAFSATATDYLWQDGSTGSTFLVSETGLYSVEVSDNTCSTFNEISISFLEYPEFELYADTTLCENEILVLNAFSPVATSYQWQDGSGSAEFTVTESGTYYVEAANEFCVTIDSAEIEYLFLPIFDLGQDTIVCKGNAIELVVSNQSVSPGTNAWSDNSTDSVLVITEQGIYWVEVANQCGSLTDTVFVEYGSCNCDFFFPSAFTPNNDGLNDAFQPIFDCDSLKTFEFEIYNRWGELLFSAIDPGLGWEGPNRNDINLMDVYAWRIRYSWTWRGEEMTFSDSGVFAIVK